MILICAGEICSDFHIYFGARNILGGKKQLQWATAME